MGIVTKGRNAIFVNNAATLPLLFLVGLAGGAAVNQNAATQDGTTGNVMHIGGYGRVYLPAISESIRALRPKPSTLHTITIDPADPTQIDLAAGFTPGASVKFMAETELMYGQKIEFYRSFVGNGKRQYGRTNFFSVKLRAGDTETTVLQRLAQAINDIPSVNYGEYPYKADFGVTNAGKLTITARDPDYILNVQAYDKVDIPSVQFAVFAPFTATPPFEGEGLYETLHAEFGLETEASTEPYSIQQWVHPVKGLKYTSVQFYTDTKRDDLTDQQLADSPLNASHNMFTIFVANGPDQEAWLAKILAFIHRSDATRVPSKLYIKSDGTELAVPGAAGTAGSFLADI